MKSADDGPRRPSASPIIATMVGSLKLFYRTSTSISNLTLSKDQSVWLPGSPFPKLDARLAEISPSFLTLYRDPVSAGFGNSLKWAAASQRQIWRVLPGPALPRTSSQCTGNAESKTITIITGDFLGVSNASMKAALYVARNRQMAYSSKRNEVRLPTYRTPVVAYKHFTI